MAEVRTHPIAPYKNRIEVFVTKKELKKALRQQGEDNIELHFEEYCLTLTEGEED